MMIRNYNHHKMASMTSSDSHIVKKLKWWLSAVWHYEVCPRHTATYWHVSRVLRAKSRERAKILYLYSFFSLCYDF